jgi:hypothetical protein
MNLWTKEHQALFHAELMDRTPPEGASPREFLDYILEALAGAFDIWAQALWSSAVLSDEAAGIFEQWLIELEQAMAAHASNFRVSLIPGDLFSREARRRLHQRKQYWTGLVLRTVRERKEASCARVAANRDDAAAPIAASVIEAPQPTTDRAAPGTPQKPKHGPEPDYETAQRVAEIVMRVAGSGRWRSKLDDICAELDDQAVPSPKTWKQRGHGDWCDCLVSERELVKKAIMHRLELARQRPTFS